MKDYVAAGYITRTHCYREGHGCYATSACLPIPSPLSEAYFWHLPLTIAELESCWDFCHDYHLTETLILYH